MNFSSIESVANFITVDMKVPAGDAYEHLLRQGVIVRPLAGYELPNHLRITVGTEAQNDRFLEEFRSFSS